jgi:hypothetical protein
MVAGATVLVSSAVTSQGAEIRAVVKKIDPDQRLLVVTVGQQERAVHVPEGVKVFDAEGRRVMEERVAMDRRDGAAPDEETVAGE